MSNKKRLLSLTGRWAPHATAHVFNFITAAAVIGLINGLTGEAAGRWEFKLDQSDYRFIFTDLQQWHVTLPKLFYQN